MDNYIVPYINISLKDNTVNSNKSIIIGKIKDSINCDMLIESGRVHKNEDFIKFIDESKYGIIPLTNYYDQTVQQIFDLYGCIYEELYDSREYVIKIYFYKIKHPELLTKKTIEQFKLIFQYDYFNKNNILNMDWHSYRLSLFTKDVEEKKFMNLAYVKPVYCSSKLFCHQINNISQMLQIYNNPEYIPIMDVTMKFENGLIYDFVKNSFIKEQEIEKYKIRGGMILDEPGTGKTLQFILFLLELKKSSLVLVPNDAIKKGWIGEFQKHLILELHDTRIEIMTFEELDTFIQVDNNILDNYEIIGIDEIHILYSKNIKLFDIIVSSKIESRWGITGTPFINDLSLFNIIKFLFGHKFKNERIANIKSLQDNLIKLFLKNLKININDDYKWPELTVKDIFVELDIVQRKLYDTEAKTTFNKTNLRKIISEVQLMFNNNDIKTPAELKIFGMNHYKKLYEKELSKLEEINKKYQLIIKNEKKFEKEEFKSRIEHYNKVINSQEESVKRHKAGYDYFMSSIETISNIFENEEVDDNCAICLGEHSPPIKYLKLCGHYFCGSCIEVSLRDTNIKCPICRKETTKHDIITVQTVEEINESPKLHEIYNVIQKSSDKFIIFSQFNILDKFQSQLNKREIDTMLFDEYSKQQNECQVLLLSSENNAEGIDLSMFDKLIIFEPFECHTYCKEIEKQLIARIHRIGRTKEVTVYRLITKNTIEEEIYSSIYLS
jgi:SNF2 family DNA or RNA helicase